MLNGIKNTNMQGSKEGRKILGSTYRYLKDKLVDEPYETKFDYEKEIETIGEGALRINDKINDNVNNYLYQLNRDAVNYIDVQGKVKTKARDDIRIELYEKYID